MKFFVCLFFCVPFFLFANSVQALESYTRSRNILFSKIYTDYKKTLYCDLEFDHHRKIIIPAWFDVSKIAVRSDFVEVEHVVPAYEFGKNIHQWWNGDKHCVSKSGRSFKGRRCAEKTSRFFRLMQADLYNLFPSIGSVNAIRSYYDLADLPSTVPPLFEHCAFKVSDNRVEVPDHAKGVVARVYLYFADRYSPVFQLSNTQKALFEKWNVDFPVSSWECTRTFRIEKIQGVENKIVKPLCQKLNLWKG